MAGIEPIGGGFAPEIGGFAPEIGSTPVQTFASMPTYYGPTGQTADLSAWAPAPYPSIEQLGAQSYQNNVNWLIHPSPTPLAPNLGGAFFGNYFSPSRGDISPYDYAMMGQGGGGGWGQTGNAPEAAAIQPTSLHIMGEERPIDAAMPGMGYPALGLQGQDAQMGFPAYGAGQGVGWGSPGPGVPSWDPQGTAYGMTEQNRMPPALQNANMQRVANYAADKGFFSNPLAGPAMASVYMAEGMADPWARNPFSGAQGGFQWLSPDRVANAQNALGLGASPESQASQASWEIMNGGYPRTLAAMNNPSASLGDIQRAMIGEFENPNMPGVGQFNFGASTPAGGDLARAQAAIPRMMGSPMSEAAWSPAMSTWQQALGRSMGMPPSQQVSQNPYGNAFAQAVANSYGANAPGWQSGGGRGF